MWLTFFFLLLILPFCILSLIRLHQLARLLPSVGIAVEAEAHRSHKTVIPAPPFCVCPAFLRVCVSVCVFVFNILLSCATVSHM